ncbi:hypothetical protein AB1484_10625 [Parafrankia sp. FMc6]|uniref:hypothetical protein n=1 Tax=Parafrankia soli TaxID=2599596 RepID=UPI0034D4544D
MGLTLRDRAGGGSATGVDQAEDHLPRNGSRYPHHFDPQLDHSVAHATPMHCS